ncbi:guanylate kinase-like [Tubulanus polymorphus]|uniref:guanylate kinase-like n=1 Tax=Tubulanus polymorphus TaxID=672921 RepID=UPI003DA25256
MIPRLFLRGVFLYKSVVTSNLTEHRLVSGISQNASKLLQSLIMSTVRPVVFSGPSGSGKSTLVKKLMKQYDGLFAFSISHTTRAPRPGEKEDVDYHYVKREYMEAAIEKGEFIEHAEFSGNMYGTSKKAVEDVAATGQICILDIDMQGVKNIKKTDLNPLYVFVKPPSMEKLEERLRGRGTESEDAIQLRLSSAKSELAYSEEVGSYDHIIINDNLDEAFTKLVDILRPLMDEMIKANHN